MRSDFSLKNMHIYIDSVYADSDEQDGNHEVGGYCSRGAVEIL